MSTVHMLDLVTCWISCAKLVIGSSKFVINFSKVMLYYIFILYGVEYSVFNVWSKKVFSISASWQVDDIDSPISGNSSLLSPLLPNSLLLQRNEPESKTKVQSCQGQDTL